MSSTLGLLTFNTRPLFKNLITNILVLLSVWGRSCLAVNTIRSMYMTVPEMLSYLSSKVGPQFRTLCVVHDRSRQCNAQTIKPSCKQIIFSYQLVCNVCTSLTHQRYIRKCSSKYVNSVRGEGCKWGKTKATNEVRPRLKWWGMEMWNESLQYPQIQVLKRFIQNADYFFQRLVLRGHQAAWPVLL